MNIIQERVNFLKQFEKYVKEHVGNENDLLYWRMEGIPAYAGTFELLNIAENDRRWKAVCTAFGEVTKNYR